MSLSYDTPLAPPPGPYSSSGARPPPHGDVHFPYTTPASAYQPSAYQASAHQPMHQPMHGAGTLAAPSRDQVDLIRRELQSFFEADPHGILRRMETWAQQRSNEHQVLLLLCERNFGSRLPKAHMQMFLHNWQGWVFNELCQLQAGGAAQASNIRTYEGIFAALQQLQQGHEETTGEVMWVVGDQLKRLKASLGDMKEQVRGAEREVEGRADFVSRLEADARRADAARAAAEDDARALRRRLEDAEHAAEGARAAGAGEAAARLRAVEAELEKTRSLLAGAERDRDGLATERAKLQEECSAVHEAMEAAEGAAREMERRVMGMEENVRVAREEAEAAIARAEGEEARTASYMQRIEMADAARMEAARVAAMAKDQQAAVARQASSQVDEARETATAAVKEARLNAARAAEEARASIREEVDRVRAEAAREVDAARAEAHRAAEHARVDSARAIEAAMEARTTARGEVESARAAVSKLKIAEEEERSKLWLELKAAREELAHAQHKASNAAHAAGEKEAEERRRRKAEDELDEVRASEDRHKRALAERAAVWGRERVALVRAVKEINTRYRQLRAEVAHQDNLRQEAVRVAVTRAIANTQHENITLRSETQHARTEVEKVQQGLSIQRKELQLELEADRRTAESELVLSRRIAASELEATRRAAEAELEGARKAAEAEIDAARRAACAEIEAENSRLREHWEREQADLSGERARLQAEMDKILEDRASAEGRLRRDLEEARARAAAPAPPPPPNPLAEDVEALSREKSQLLAEISRVRAEAERETALRRAQVEGDKASLEVELQNVRRLLAAKEREIESVTQSLEQALCRGRHTPHDAAEEIKRLRRELADSEARASKLSARTAHLEGSLDAAMVDLRVTEDRHYRESLHSHRTSMLNASTVSASPPRSRPPPVESILETARSRARVASHQVASCAACSGAAAERDGARRAAEVEALGLLEEARAKLRRLEDTLASAKREARDAAELAKRQETRAREAESTLAAVTSELRAKEAELSQCQAGLRERAALAAELKAVKFSFEEAQRLRADSQSAAKITQQGAEGMREQLSAANSERNRLHSEVVAMTARLTAAEARCEHQARELRSWETRRESWLQTSFPGPTKVSSGGARTTILTTHSPQNDRGDTSPTRQAPRPLPRSVPATLSTSVKLDPPNYRSTLGGHSHLPVGVPLKHPRLGGEMPPAAAAGADAEEGGLPSPRSPPAAARIPAEVAAGQISPSVLAILQNLNVTELLNSSVGSPASERGASRTDRALDEVVAEATRLSAANTAAAEAGHGSAARIARTNELIRTLEARESEVMTIDSSTQAVFSANAGTQSGGVDEGVGSDLPFEEWRPGQAPHHHHLTSPSGLFPPLHEELYPMERAAPSSPPRGRGAAAAAAANPGSPSLRSIDGGDSRRVSPSGAGFAFEYRGSVYDELAAEMAEEGDEVAALAGRVYAERDIHEMTVRIRKEAEAEAEAAIARISGRGASRSPPSGAPIPDRSPARSLEGELNLAGGFADGQVDVVGVSKETEISMSRLVERRQRGGSRVARRSFSSDEDERATAPAAMATMAMAEATVPPPQGPAPSPAAPAAPPPTPAAAAAPAAASSPSLGNSGRSQASGVEKVSMWFEGQGDAPPPAAAPAPSASPPPAPPPGSGGVDISGTSARGLAAFANLGADAGLARAPGGGEGEGEGEGGSGGGGGRGGGGGGRGGGGIGLAAFAKLGSDAGLARAPSLGAGGSGLAAFATLGSDAGLARAPSLGTGKGGGGGGGGGGDAAASRAQQLEEAYARKAEADRRERQAELEALRSRTPSPLLGGASGESASGSASARSQKQAAMEALFSRAASSAGAGLASGGPRAGGAPHGAGGRGGGRGMSEGVPLVGGGEATPGTSQREAAMQMLRTQSSLSGVSESSGGGARAYQRMVSAGAGMAAAAGVERDGLVEDGSTSASEDGRPGRP